MPETISQPHTDKAMPSSEEKRRTSGINPDLIGLPTGYDNPNAVRVAFMLPSEGSDLRAKSNYSTQRSEQGQAFETQVAYAKILAAIESQDDAYKATCKERFAEELAKGTFSPEEEHQLELAIRIANLPPELQESLSGKIATVHRKMS